MHVNINMALLHIKQKDWQQLKYCEKYLSTEGDQDDFIDLYAWLLVISRVPYIWNQKRIKWKLFKIIIFLFNHKL